MTKAASKASMNALHARIAEVFARLLDGYMKQMDAMDTVNMDELEAEMVAALMEGPKIDPRILAAVTKFLKDNEVTFEAEYVETLSDQAKLLQERARKRPALADLPLVPRVVQ